MLDTSAQCNPASFECPRLALHSQPVRRSDSPLDCLLGPSHPWSARSLVSVSSRHRHCNSSTLATPLDALLLALANFSGNRPAPAGTVVSIRWISIFSVTTGSSMQAITLTVPPHSRYVSS